MRLTLLASLTLLVTGGPLDGAMAQRPRAVRLSAVTAGERLEKVQSLIRAQRHRVDQRYGYEAVQGTLSEFAGISRSRPAGMAMGRALKALGTRVYALWVSLDRRIDGELDRLDANREMFTKQSYARTRDVAWLERVGGRITEEIMEAERCLDELTESAISGARHRLVARQQRAKMKRLQASLARLPGGGGDDPLANLRDQIEFADLAAASARATSLGLEDSITALTGRTWVPSLVPDAERRETRLEDIELPLPLLKRRSSDPWVSGAGAGSRLAEAIATSIHRQAIERLSSEPAPEALESVANTRDALDKSRIRALQIEGLSAVRDARRLQEGLERLPELRSVVVYGNSEALFEAHRADKAELERLCDQIIAQGAALNELLNAVLLLRRQLIFHAMVAERGRELRATGTPVDIRPLVRRVFASSRAAHVLERPGRRSLEAFYSLKEGPLSRPQHLHEAVEAFVTGDRAVPKEKKRPSPATATATLAVARLLAKLSDDRVHVPLRAAKQAVRKWRFPVPGYPEKPNDALQVLADDLTAWVHLPAAIWSEAALDQLIGDLQSNVDTLNNLTTSHRPTDGMKVGSAITLRDGMHIEVVLALTAEHSGALEVTLAGVELVGEGLYREDTPGLLFTGHRLSLPAAVDPKRGLLRVRLP